VQAREDKIQTELELSVAVGFFERGWRGEGETARAGQPERRAEEERPGREEPGRD